MIAMPLETETSIQRVTPWASGLMPFLLNTSLVSLTVVPMAKASPQYAADAAAAAP